MNDAEMMTVARNEAQAAYESGLARKSRIRIAGRFSGNFFLGLYLLLLPVIPSSDGLAGGKTEIIVIGTVHKETGSFRIRDLVEILNKVKPDVILFELPPEMMTPSYEFIEMPTESLEQQAVREYVEQTGAKIRPIDIDGRNAFYERTHAQEMKCNQELAEAFNNKKLGPEAQKVFDLLMAANQKRDRIGQSDAAVINSFASDMAMNERLWMVNEGIPEIVRLTPDLQGCKEFWDLSRAEWIHRNNHMIANIKRYSTEFQGRRLAVICGFEHRYYLRSHLYNWRDEPPGYTVKEHWEY